MNRNRRAAGLHWEKHARRVLESHGLKTLQSNYQCRMGEIDLIMMDGETLVFVEVRYRRRIDFGTGAETVTATKQRKIIRTAEFYLQNSATAESVVCRLDVVSITGEGESVQTDWIRDAFQVEG